LRACQRHASRTFGRHFVASVSLLSAVLLAGPLQADVVDDAPEAKDYELLFDLAIPTHAAFHAKPPAYAVDKSATWASTFDRVAYFLELQRPGEPRRFVWVSMDAFSADPASLALPHAAAGTFFQQPIASMNVVSNHPDIKDSKGLPTGNLEFWPSNYGTANVAGVPGASAKFYDTGDAPASGAGYGSMQVHDHGTGTTLLAYNAWSNKALPSDLGIGNNVKAAANGQTHADWTFRRNATEYNLRRLRIFVRKGPTPGKLLMTVTSPQAHQVVQRDATGQAWLRVTGQLQVWQGVIEARGVAVQGGKDTAWTLIDPHPGKTFVGHLQLEQGWYQLQVRLRDGDETVLQMTTGEFGVGEVFITAGQSNSANSGKPPQTPQDKRVGAWGPGGWQFAADPQPIATGAGGTPWPLLGGLLAAKLDVPIGFISVGWGGTSVAQWLPGAAKKLYPRLLLAADQLGPEGARAVLWHQGESDAAGKTSTKVYADRLKTVIAAMRKDAGWPIPWYVARASYLPKAAPTAMAAVVAGQQAVIDADPLVLPGPLTDDLIGSKWRHDLVHFNGAGLLEHATRWADLIVVPKIEVPTTAEPEPDAGVAADAHSAQDAGAPLDAGAAEVIAAPDDSHATDAASSLDVSSPQGDDDAPQLDAAPCDCPTAPAADSGCTSAPSRHPPYPALFLLSAFLLMWGGARMRPRWRPRRSES